MQAAREDEIGKHAVGAMERVVAASEETLKTIKTSSTMCVEDVVAHVAVVLCGSYQDIVHNVL